MDSEVERKKIDKSISNNRAFYKRVGAPTWKIAMWFFVSAIFFTNHLNPFSGLRIFLLRLFGAKIGEKCNIKPGVFIRFPWNLEMGNYVGIGEEVWIDSYGKVVLNNQVTISQGAMILTGHHNFWDSAFNSVVVPLTTLEEGVWICSKAIVLPGAITCKSHSILTAGSVLSKGMKPYTIYSGNPAKPVGERLII
jgi:putative colanic acid biosynthesis acetyltransferase WcaF